jgi:hypothetical protein
VTVAEAVVEVVLEAVAVLVETAEAVDHAVEAAQVAVAVNNQLSTLHNSSTRIPLKLKLKSTCQLTNSLTSNSVGS